MRVLFALMTLLFISCGSAQNENGGSVKTVSADEFEKLIQEEGTILDVRTPEETAQGMIKGAVELNFNSSAFPEHFKKLDKKKPVYIYCRSGGRSAKAADMMAKEGYTVYNLDGGMLGWEESGKDVVKK